jgi:hypothetical protein
MNSIAFNIHITQVLRGKYQFCLGVLPIGLMFASFIVLWPFAHWLSDYLGIPENAPLKDHPNGIIWIIIFLIVMVSLMISGYLCGWILNAMIVRTFFGWNANKTRRVFLYSEVPTEWLKGGKNVGDNPISAAYEKWAITRKKGMWNYIFRKGVLGWGAIMYVIMAILPALKGSSERTYSYYLWQAMLWGAAGSLFGSILWYLSEKHYIKNQNSKSLNKTNSADAKNRAAD